MNVLIILLSVLLFCMVAGLMAIIPPLFYKKDDCRSQKISSALSYLSTVMTAIIGVATIIALWKGEERERVQNQPLYVVSVEQTHSLETDLFDNEEYQVMNVGNKTKSKTVVEVYSFIELSYTDINSHEKPEIRLLPLMGYFGFDMTTGNLDGKIQYSYLSGNNWELYYNFLQGTQVYSDKHPGCMIEVKKKHFFFISYEDIYGAKHQLVKDSDGRDVSLDHLNETRMRAESDAEGRMVRLSNLDPEQVVEELFLR